MIDYKVEDLKLLNRKATTFIGKDRLFDWETEFSQEEKLQFIDKYYTDKGEGLGTYMYNLIKKWEAESPSLPHDSWGYVKTVSLKAWLKKNDSKHLVDDHYRYGHYYMINREYHGLSMKVNPVWSGHTMYEGHDKIVDQWFHDLLVRLLENEKVWEKDHNPTVLKVRKIVEYSKKYSDLNLKVIGPTAWNGEKVLDEPDYEFEKTFKTTKPTEQDLDNILKLYEEIEGLINSKVTEYTTKLGWEVFTPDSE